MWLIRLCMAPLDRLYPHHILTFSFTFRTLCMLCHQANYYSCPCFRSQLWCLFLFLVLSTISPALIFLYPRHPRAPQTLSPDGFRPAYLQLCVCVSVLCLCLRARVGQKARARGLGRGTKSSWRICISRKRAILSSSGP